MIRLDDVTVTHRGAARPTLRNAHLVIPDGDLCLVVGPTGAGKSTLLGVMTGLVPHATGSRLDGVVTVAGRDTRTHPPRELADVVGVVGQDPLAGFVTDVVEDELAYAMEQLGLAPAVMRKRVEETLDLLGIVDLRDRPLADLSGGEQQRVAIGSVLTAHPKVLVLDEPTSALDPTAAEEVLATLRRLVHDLGMTVVIAEHRLERVAASADLVIHVPGDGSVTTGDPATLFSTTSVAPPVVHLGRLVGWEPLPLSIRDARRAATGLRDQLPPPPAREATDGAAVLTATGVTVEHGDVVAVAGVDVTLDAGGVAALMGRNGSGKSSLLWALQGSGPRQNGTVTVTAANAGKRRNPRSRESEEPRFPELGSEAVDPGTLGPAAARKLVGLVPQTAADLLYLPTVDQELAQADRESDAAPGSARSLLHRLVPGITGERHPRDLSEGQRLALVLAIQLVAGPPVVLLDEPTRGLDEHAKAHLAALLRGLAADGRAIFVATHDVEFVAEVADRVLVMAQGEVVADGPTAEIVAASPAFAPQVAKILAPAAWLTVAQVKTALEPTTTTSGVAT